MQPHCISAQLEFERLRWPQSGRWFRRRGDHLGCRCSAASQRRRDQSNSVTKSTNLPRPIMRTGTCLHGNHAHRLLGEEFEHVLPAQLFAENDATRGVCPMGLKHILRQIQADCANFHRGHSFSPVASLRWLQQPPFWHIDAVEGVSTPSLKGHRYTVERSNHEQRPASGSSPREIEGCRRVERRPWLAALQWRINAQRRHRPVEIYLSPTAPAGPPTRSRRTVVLCPSRSKSAPMLGGRRLVCIAINLASDQALQSPQITVADAEFLQVDNGVVEIFGARTPVATGSG